MRSFLFAALFLVGCLNDAQEPPKNPAPSGDLSTAGMWPSFSVQVYGEERARVYAALIVDDKVFPSHNSSGFVELTRGEGHASTTVDRIGAEAQLTKGSFFHHVDTKEAIAREAMAAFAQEGMELYAAAYEYRTDDSSNRFTA